MAYDVNVLMVDRTRPGSEQAVRLWMADGYQAMMEHHAKQPMARYLMIATLEGRGGGFENVVNMSPKLDTLLTMLFHRLERVRQAYRLFGRHQFSFNIDSILERAEKERLDKFTDSYAAACQKSAEKVANAG